MIALPALITLAARLPLARIAETHELVEEGRAIGNVVMPVDSDART